MKLAIKLAVVAAVAAFGVAYAAGDPIKVRKALMQATGAAAGLAGGMMRGKMEYNADAGKSAIATLRAAAHAHGSFYPEGSLTGDTTASPRIAEDAEGWNKTMAKFIADADAAAAASGRDGPADLDAFKAAVGPVLANCKACHEAYRVKN
ncbi:MAG: cytochrome c [Ahrensia sp.]|nr:cytochrome c [Ahrensia sp.]